MVRGKQSLRVECAPAFHYALHEHRTSLVSDDTIPENSESASDKQKKALFESDELTMDLRFIAESVVDGVPLPSIDLQTLDLSPRGHKGLSICVDLDLVEGQVVTFVLRTPKTAKEQYSAVSTKEHSEQLGVSFEREFDFTYVVFMLQHWTWQYCQVRPTFTRKRIHRLPRYPPSFSFVLSSAQDSKETSSRFATWNK